MEDRYNLSIIIPHYNSPDLLAKLLSTIPEKKDIQTIIIDDHSDENVKVKIHKLQLLYKDRDFLFLENNTEEHNAGATRNIGLKYAKGKWLLFADADDFFLEGFYDVIKDYFDTDYDIVFFPPTSMELDTGEIGTRYLTYANYVGDYLQKPCLESEIHLRYLWPGPWCKLIRNSMVQNSKITFESIQCCNDDMFSVQNGFFADKIAVSDNTIYCITRSAGSITTKLDIDAFDTRVQERIRRFHFLKEHLTKEEFRDAEAYKIAVTYLLLILRRRYGMHIFFRYFKIFRQNHMFIFDIRVVSPKNIMSWVRGHSAERAIKKRYN